MKFFQSPPELGDLGGLDTLKRRQKALRVHRRRMGGGGLINRNDYRETCVCTLAYIRTGSIREIAF
jgi:hypothetical protein